MEPYLVAAALVVYNNLLNLWPPFNRTWFVPLNVSLTGALLLVGFGPLDLDATQLGLGDLDVVDAFVGAGIGLALTLPLYVAPRWKRARGWVADERVAHLRGPAIAYQIFVRIPLGTAVLEEVAFRGILFASWRDLGDARAAIYSSIAFGLWHISPALNQLRANRRAASPAQTAAFIAGTVAVMSLAGVALVGLRLWTKGLVAPILLHAVVNGSATWAALLAHRRVGRGGTIGA